MIATIAVNWAVRLAMRAAGSVSFGIAGVTVRPLSSRMHSAKDVRFLNKSASSVES
jgi:hypothetical protein